jgi:hypothetical protein
MMLQVLRRYFRIPAQDRDIIHAFSGVRPIHDDNAENPSAVTRKYVLDIDDGTLRPRANKFAVLCVGRSKGEPVASVSLGRGLFSAGLQHLFAPYLFEAAASSANCGVANWILTALSVCEILRSMKNITGWTCERRREAFFTV